MKVKRIVSSGTLGEVPSHGLRCTEKLPIIQVIWFMAGKVKMLHRCLQCCCLCAVLSVSVVWGEEQGISYSDKVVWHLFYQSLQERPDNSVLSISVCTNVLRFGAPPEACDDIRSSFHNSDEQTITSPVLGYFNLDASGFIGFYIGPDMIEVELFFYNGMPVSLHSDHIEISKVSSDEYNIVFRP